MANRFYSPNQQFADATGAPYAGGSLAFYASGTSAPLATYSDSALTIANTNPVVLDSAGRAGNIFLQNLAYKVVLSDVNNNVIWTDDPVFSSDYSARAKLLSGSGSPNGNTAGTAGSPGIGADTYWDATNNILYVCTTTGNAVSAVWTAVNAGAVGSVVPVPQGYLTLSSGNPVPNSGGDIVGSTVVYYTPYMGNLIPVYNGASFQSLTFSELTLNLVSQAASTIYDIFVFSSSGVLTLATGPAWAGSAAGSGSRGTGAGTTQIVRLGGLWVNAVSMSAKNGSTTYTIPANQGTYVGSIFIDATPGQVTCHRTFGQSRKWGLWNCYNRVPIYLKAGDGTASWLVGSSLGPANGNSANSLTIFSGLTEEVADLRYESRATTGTIGPGVTALFQIAVGFNNNSVAAGRIALQSLSVASSNSTAGFDMCARYVTIPNLPGINTIYALERNSNAGSINVAATGQEAGSVLTALWRG
jgi:hypothetical protein